ncbi:MAG TPA: hypothetical protein VJQ06_04630 [Rhizomicrobium sp.]|nr:hypothetical protein [Rhizomicrobium sp.]
MNSNATGSLHQGQTAGIIRILLAWYLDFLLFSVLAALVSYAAHWEYGNTWLAQLVGFFVVRGSGALFIETPGMTILGIRRNGTRDEQSFPNESWLTLLLGTVFILDGAKQAVRWTEYARTLPEFGTLPGPIGQMIFALCWGACLMIAGVMLLQMRKVGFWLALAVTAATIASVISSWPLWDQALAQEVIGRRMAQGIGVRPGEIEFIQRFVPMALVLGNGLLLGLLIGTRRRFQT